MVAFAEPRRPPRRAYAPQCVGSSSCANPLDQPLSCNDRNQQYSIIAITGGSASIQERYAYTAYGAPTIADASGTPRTATAEGNRFTYTGREWDEELNLYHYRARMYDPVAGRFCGRDPIQFYGSRWNLYKLAKGRATVWLDPTGLLPCTCTCDPGQAPANNNINNIVNDVLRNVRGRPIRNVLVNDLVTGGPFETGIEEDIRSQMNSGDAPVKNCGGGTAPVMVLQCGSDRFCVGTDKIGHFFEEGLAYYDIAVTHGHGLDYAIGWGEWTEGLVPNGMDANMWEFLHNQVGQIAFDMAGGPTPRPGGSTVFPAGDWFGYFGDTGLFGNALDPNGSASPADLAANLSGYYFWERFLSSPEGRPPQFDICDFAHPGWDHLRNPNVPGAGRNDPPPNRPVR